METKFKICDKVFSFNTATGKIEEGAVRDARIIATDISQNESGEEVCNDVVVLYSLKSGLVLAETELFASREECIEHYFEVLKDMKS